MLRTSMRVLAWLGLTAAVAASVLAIYVTMNWNRTWDDVPAPDLHASLDPAVIERGRYLVTGPAHCTECHGSSFTAFQNFYDDTAAMSKATVFSAEGVVARAVSAATALHSADVNAGVSARAVNLSSIKSGAVNAKALMARSDSATGDSTRRDGSSRGSVAADNNMAVARTAADGGTIALSGGYRFPLGPLGTLYSKNLTPDTETGIGRYTDPQIARMLRHGVRPDGQASIPLLMPFGNMSDDDIVAILSFLRAQPPVRNVIPENEWTLVGKVMRTLVSAAKPNMEVLPPQTAPAQQPTRERGEYLARSVANCGGCHTAFNEMTGVPTAPMFTGGNLMEPAAQEGADRSLWFRPPNLTPREGSALMKFPDRATFVARFKVGGRHYEGSPMPWEAFSRMTSEDIGALYEFLHAQPAQGDPSPEDPRVAQR